MAILDVNDHKPYFTECADFNVSESTKVGEFVSQVRAEDDDFVQNKLSYSLASKDEVCELYLKYQNLKKIMFWALIILMYGSILIKLAEFFQINYKILKVWLLK